MSVFSDVMGRKWIIELDGLTMGRIRDEAKVNLSDLSANEYLKLQADPTALVETLLVICRKQIVEKGIDSEIFAKGIRKDALKDSVAAIHAAAADFFPESEWSDLLSRLKTAENGKVEVRELMPALAILNEPGIPQAIKDRVMQQIDAMLLTMGVPDSAGGTLPGKESAGGPTATLSPPVTSSPENAESTHAV